MVDGEMTMLGSILFLLGIVLFLGMMFYGALGGGNISRLKSNKPKSESAEQEPI